MGPDFGQIERIETIGSGLGIGHYLYRQGPAWVLAAGDSVKQIATVEVRISAGHGRGFFVAEKFHALMGVEIDRKSTRLNSSHVATSYAGFCWQTKKTEWRR